MQIIIKKFNSIGALDTAEMLEINTCRVVYARLGNRELQLYEHFVYFNTIQTALKFQVLDHGGLSETWLSKELTRSYIFLGN